MSPYPSSPVSFRGLFVRMRIVVSPRSARIWLPIPHSRASAGKPSARFASTVSSPFACSSYAAKLVQEADPAALLAHVEDDAAPFRLDARERLLELLAAVAEERVEHVAGQALGVHADEDVLRALDVPLHEGEVLLVGQELAVGDRLELAVLGRQPHGDDALDELLRTAPVLDEVGDRDHLQVVPLAERRRDRARGPSSRRRS